MPVQSCWKMEWQSQSYSMNTLIGLTLRIRIGLIAVGK